MKRKLSWQLESSLAVIYWSVTFISLFLGLIFILEKAGIHWKSFVFFVIFIGMTYLSFQRSLIFKDTGLVISYALPWRKSFILFNEIHLVRVINSNVRIEYKQGIFDCRLKKDALRLFLEMLNEKIPPEKIALEKAFEN